MKNRMKFYSKCIIPVVIVGVMLSFVSAVWAAQQQQPSQESKPVVMTKTDVWIDTINVGITSRHCYFTNQDTQRCDIYEGDEVMISGNVMICGCHNRPVRVEVDVDAQLLKENMMTMFQQHPSEPVCYRSSVCPVAYGFSNGATWVAFPGTHILKFTVDSKNEISEINELNNSKSVTVTVKHRPLPLPETKPKIPIKIPMPNSPAGSQQR